MAVIGASRNGIFAPRDPVAEDMWLFPCILVKEADAKAVEMIVDEVQNHKQNREPRPIERTSEATVHPEGDGEDGEGEVTQGDSLNDEASEKKDHEEVSSVAPSEPVTATFSLKTSGTARGVIQSEGVGLVSILRRLGRSLKPHGALVRRLLSAIGEAVPPTGRGLRVLCLDGGGSAGIATIQYLKEVTLT